jgi:hypothetical protein
MDDARPPDPTPDDGRNETEAERLDRNLAELLQELRVAGIGTQVLFGFLLSIPFTTRFASLDDASEVLYTADLVLAALATATLMAPVAHHRLLFRRHAKARVLRLANASAIAGLILAGLAISGSLVLVVTMVWSGTGAWLVAGVPVVAIFALWFAVPAVGKEPERY